MCSILVHCETRSGGNNAVMKDCSKHCEPLVYDEQSYDLLRFECMVQTRVLSFMVVSLPELNLERLIDSLKR